MPILQGEFDFTTKSPERQSRNQIGLSRAKLAKTAKLRD
jgi:hypothetical protein